MKTFIVVVLYLFSVIALFMGIACLCHDEPFYISIGLQLLVSAAMLAGFAFIVNAVGKISKRLDPDPLYRMAEGGSAFAMHELAVLAWKKYNYSRDYQVKEDLTALSAYEFWLKKAADAGHEEAQKEWEAYCEQKERRLANASGNNTQETATQPIGDSDK